MSDPGLIRRKDHRHVITLNPILHYRLPRGSPQHSYCGQNPISSKQPITKLLHCHNCDRKYPRLTNSTITTLYAPEQHITRMTVRSLTCLTNLTWAPRQSSSTSSSRDPIMKNTTSTGAQRSRFRLLRCRYLISNRQTVTSLNCPSKFCKCPEPLQFC